ncbi:hypothetical protein LJC53_05520 [Bacteroidales bacterium OttesenSCG-928-C03]|nr:hypothetical protein [Bacteroidales bacterium OttesenSCG-928-C03]MDL2326749.1 hypothetical protein [Bacteroidales bacterium OttesenSCG-928-A14]
MGQSNSSIFDVVSGNESIKVSIGLDVKTVGYLAAAIFVVGIILIVINKKVIK